VSPRGARGAGWNFDLELEALDERARLARARLLLDIGSGPADFAVRLLPRYPDLRILCLDTCPSTASPSPRVRSVRADARALPVASGIADVAYARFLFQHLSAPERALGEMIRATRRGGTVAVLEVDEGCLVFHPMPEPLHARAVAFNRGREATGLHRTLGRELRQMLARAALSDIRMATIALNSEEVGLEAFWSIVMTRRGLSPSPPPAVLSRSTEAFGCLVLFLATGRVP
jgi:ubiquinone/menaquinone biosynthesis C-methylase UbiE